MDLLDSVIPTGKTTQNCPEKIRQTALRLLTRRNHSQQELLQKLRGRGHSTEAILPILQDLLRVGLLNDASFAEHYIHWRRQKGYGPDRIALELKARGITPETIAELLQITDNAWFIEIQRVWRKQFKGAVPTDFKSRAKQMRFLQYRGFTHEQINSLLKDTYDQE